MLILVLNAGSSSLKFKLFNQTKKVPIEIAAGVVDAIGLPHSHIKLTSPLKKFKSKSIKNHQEGLSLILEWLQKFKIIKSLDQISVIGHRVVHGGEIYRQPVIVNAKVIRKIKKLSELAPLHNPANLNGILVSQKFLPKAIQYVVFDTAFHENMPAKAFRYPIAGKYYHKYKVRKFGFHGISHQFVHDQAVKVLKKNKFKHRKIIVCHLGNGCSISAIKNGVSQDTTMGFTPLEGLMMGTRCGSIDPSLPLILARKEKVAPEKMMELLNFQSGLLGVSQVSSDIRVVRAAALKKKPNAILALEMFSYITAKYIAAMAAALNGVDAIVFTAGIGEHAFYLRSDICSYLSFMGVHLDLKNNRKNETIISTQKSPVKVLAIPTNEELAIALEAQLLISNT